MLPPAPLVPSPDPFAHGRKHTTPAIRNTVAPYCWSSVPDPMGEGILIPSQKKTSFPAEKRSSFPAEKRSSFPAEFCRAEVRLYDTFSQPIHFQTYSPRRMPAFKRTLIPQRYQQIIPCGAIIKLLPIRMLTSRQTKLNDTYHPPPVLQSLLINLILYRMYKRRHQHSPISCNLPRILQPPVILCLTHLTCVSHHYFLRIMQQKKITVGMQRA